MELLRDKGNTRSRQPDVVCPRKTRNNTEIGIHGASALDLRLVLSAAEGDEAEGGEAGEEGVGAGLGDGAEDTRAIEGPAFRGVDAGKTKGIHVAGDELPGFGADGSQGAEGDGEIGGGDVSIGIADEGVVFTGFGAHDFHENFTAAAEGDALEIDFPGAVADVEGAVESEVGEGAGAADIAEDFEAGGITIDDSAHAEINCAVDRAVAGDAGVGVEGESGAHGGDVEGAVIEGDLSTVGGVEDDGAGTDGVGAGAVLNFKGAAIEGEGLVELQRHGAAAVDPGGGTAAEGGEAGERAGGFEGAGGEGDAGGVEAAGDERSAVQGGGIAEGTATGDVDGVIGGDGG